MKTILGTWIGVIFRISGIFTSDQKSQTLKSRYLVFWYVFEVHFYDIEMYRYRLSGQSIKIECLKSEKVKNRFWTELWKMIGAFQRLIAKNQKRRHLEKWRSKWSMGIRRGYFSENLPKTRSKTKLTEIPVMNFAVWSKNDGKLEILNKVAETCRKSNGLLLA